MEISALSFWTDMNSTTTRSLEAISADQNEKQADYEAGPRGELEGVR